MNQAQDTPQLDAFGHLNWTVGNEDWIACFDAIVEGDQIHYHVVVDCDSGGFMDTLEDRRIPLADVASLYSLPSYWADICSDHYLDSSEPEHEVKADETDRTTKAWRQHLDSLVAQGACREDHLCGCCSECQEAGPDPVRDGWVGSDGRP